MIRDDFNDVVHCAVKRGTDLDQHFTGNDGAVFAHFCDGGHAYARRFCQFLFLHFPVDQKLEELFITCGHWLHPRNKYDNVLYHIFPDFSTVFSNNPAISSFFVLPTIIVSWAKIDSSRGHARTPYFFVYCGAKNEGGTIRNGLDFPVEESYNLSAPGERQICRNPQERFPYDHMFDHNALRRTWKHRRKERRRAGFPERKGSNVFHAHVTPSSSSRLGAGCRGFKSLHSDQKSSNAFWRLGFFHKKRDLKDERYRASVRWTLATASDQAPAGARIKSLHSDHRTEPPLAVLFRSMVGMMFALPGK